MEEIQRNGLIAYLYMHGYILLLSRLFHRLCQYYELRLR